MKAAQFLVISFIISLKTAFAQNPVLDSIIAIQNDSLLRIQLKNFELGGIEKTIALNGISADSFLTAAARYLGTPHCMGGNGKTTANQSGKICIDCSGLLYASFCDMGINLTIHNSQDLARYGKLIADTAQLRKGDLLFFIKSYHPKNSTIVITHSAIVMGDGRMIHTSAQNGVEIIPIKTQYWSSRFIFATRLPFIE
jgi:cell wall-associated NlpC family hydrolase